MADEIGKIIQERNIKSAIQRLGSNTANKAIDQLIEIGPAACNYLIAALKDKNHKVRMNAATGLGGIKDKKGVEPLIRCLTEDPNPEVQDSACNALSVMGYPVMKTLISQLEDEDVELDEEKKKKFVKVLDNMELSILTKNSQAVYYLAKGNFAECAKLGGAAVPCLISSLTKADENLKEKLETTLIRIGPEAFQGLMNTLSTPNDKLRMVVMQILDKIDPKLFHLTEKATYYMAKGEVDKCVELGNSAVNPLIRALEDPRKEVVNNATEGLKRLGNIAVDELIKELRGRKRKTKSIIAKLLGEIRDKRAVEVLISCLSDIESDVRINAAQALCDIGDEKSIPFLINKALLDKDKKVRVFTGERLKKMGTVIAPSLIKILDEPKSSEEIKEISVKVLGEIKAEKSVDILTNIMLEGKGKLRELAAKSLGDIGSKKAVKSLIDVLDKAKELSGWSRGFNATVALGKIGDTRALGPLINILHDENYLPQLQGAAAEALGKIGDKKVIDELIKALENKKIQREVISAIGTLRNAKGAEPLLKILRAEDSSSPLKILIIEALGNLSDYSASDDIIKLMKKDLLKLPAVIALGKMREDKAIPEIEEILFDKNSDEKLRKACVDTLIQIKKKKSVMSMLKVLKSEELEPIHKKVIIDSFQEIGDIIIKPFMEELKKEELNLELCQTLIKIMGNLKSPKAVPDLVELMEISKEEILKGTIALALGNIRDASCVNKLMTELKNTTNSTFLRESALLAMLNIGDKKSIPLLIKILDDQDEQLRDYALKAFKKTGVPVIEEEEKEAGIAG